MIRVLVVDDSAYMRRVLRQLLEADPDIQVVGTAFDGVQAYQQVERLEPDVVTLDVEMPKEDGLTFLQRLMRDNPHPVVMVSSLTQRGSETTIKALALGAVDFVAKPSGSISLDIDRVAAELRQKVKVAASANRQMLVGSQRGGPATVRLADLALHQMAHRVVCIAASTGGPRALEALLGRIPPGFAAGMLITQHMPQGFTKSLARRLDAVSSLHVIEATGGEVVRTGEAYVAPGGSHLVVRRGGRLALDDGPEVNFVKPAADVMMRSAVGVYGHHLLGVVLTGMGKDGTAGAAALKKAGAQVFVQHPAACVIPSMPQSVVDSGHADRVCTLEELAQAICEWAAGGAIMRSRGRSNGV